MTYQGDNQSLMPKTDVIPLTLILKMTTIPHLQKSKGWRSGESARLPSMLPGFKSWRWHHMWVEFVVGSLLCSERFFSGSSGIPLSSKTNISKFQFDQESGRWRTILWMCYVQIIIYLFILPHRLLQCQSLLTTVLFRLLLPGRSYPTYLWKLTTLGFKQFTAYNQICMTRILFLFITIFLFIII